MFYFQTIFYVVNYKFLNKILTKSCFCSILHFFNDFNILNSEITRFEPKTSDLDGLFLRLVFGWRHHCVQPSSRRETLACNKRKFLSFLTKMVSIILKDYKVLPV